MNTKLFSEAISEVGDKYFEEAEFYIFINHVLINFIDFVG